VRRHRWTPIDPAHRSLGIVVATHFLLQPVNRALTAVRLRSHLRGIKPCVLDHSPDLYMPRRRESLGSLPLCRAEVITVPLVELPSREAALRVVGEPG
jgi:hypothetical protein